MSIARESTNLAATDEIPTAIVQRLLSELTPTKHPNKRVGPRAVKRLVQQAAGKLGADFYISERQFSEIARQMGIPIEPRQGNRAGRPVCSWWIGISKRSVQRFIARHGVRPV